MARRSSSLATAGVVVVALLAIGNLSGAFVSSQMKVPSAANSRAPTPATVRRVFESELGLAPESKSVDKDGKEIKSRLSPGDDFVMPQNEEEEEKAQMWRSEFDDLPDAEKIQSPPVIIALLSVVIPFVVGAYVLISTVSE
uniref:Uncharacterized protein n=1 Tax=Strombidinopsis acuminata TaxID=141414 RepID=A0A7S3SMM5_9SPIT|mmetsp:Transcript_81725/g.210437  ORF Transcript_81725/g.210437 Transcript_81725/m.210437 type:complete len:141 (+) Transcript_81725:58-480(+)